MSFAVSASATRVVASARAPVKAQRASAAAAFAAPASKTNSAARLSMRSVADAVALRADKSVAARAGPRGNLAVFAGRFETERTYIMIKPDGVQRGYVRSHAPLLRDRDGHLFFSPPTSDESVFPPNERSARDGAKTHFLRVFPKRSVCVCASV